MYSQDKHFSLEKKNLKRTKMKIIDLATWKRREHFQYFCSLDDPYWSMTTSLDCTRTYWNSKHRGESFFLSYLHRSLQAVNSVDELKMRINDHQVVCFERVHASTTVLRPDETFGCSFIEFFDDFGEFVAAATSSIDKTIASSGMCLEQDYRSDQIYYSSIPWQYFSGLTYAKSFNTQDSVPRITFGKMKQDGDKLMLPLAIQVHHGLADGLHVARFLEHFQNLLMT